MKNPFTFYIKKALQIAAILIIFISVSSEIKAQKTQNGQMSIKTINNTSIWKSNVQSQKIIPADTIKSYPIKKSTTSTTKYWVN